MEGAERGGGESGSVVMMTGGGLSRDMVERRAGRKEGRKKGRKTCMWWRAVWAVANTS